nr:MAG TPA: hypothetical protein [Caudoviricetes sp.]
MNREYSIDDAIADLSDAQDWIAIQLADKDNPSREKLAQAVINIGESIQILVDYEEQT